MRSGDRQTRRAGKIASLTYVLTNRKPYIKVYRCQGLTPRLFCCLLMSTYDLWNACAQTFSLSTSLTYSYLIMVVNRLEISILTVPPCHQRWVISEDSTRTCALSPTSLLPVVKSSVRVSRVLYHLSFSPVHIRISVLATCRNIAG